MPQARPYDVPGKRSPLDQFLHGAATTAPDVLKRMLKIQEPMTPAELSLMKYREHLIDIENKRHLLAMKKYEEEPGREETKAAMEFDIKEKGAVSEFERTKEGWETKGETTEAKEAAAKAKARVDWELEEHKSLLRTGEALAKHDLEEKQRLLAAKLTQATIDKVDAEAASIPIRDAISQRQLELDQEGFTWDKTMDQANLMWEYSKLVYNAETTKAVEEYRATVRLMADRDAAGLRVHDMTKQAMKQMDFYAMMVMTAPSAKQKEDAFNEFKVAEKRFASAAKEFDGITYNAGNMKFERRWHWFDTFERGEAGTFEGPPPRPQVPLSAPEYRMPALPERPVLPGQLPAETPTMGPPLSAGATILSQAQRSLTKAAPQAEVDKAISDLGKAGLYPPYNPKQIERFLQDFSPAQVEEIIKALTKEIEDALTY